MVSRGGGRFRREERLKTLDVLKSDGNQGSYTLRRLSMKRLNIIFLSLVIMHAGVAWAIQNCLLNTGHVDHGESSHSHQAPAHSETIGVPKAFELSHSRASSLHCLQSEHQIGPMAFPDTPRLEVRIGSAQEKLSLLQSGLASIGEPDHSGLRDLFKWTSLSSTLASIARHLFLSVLQI